MTVEQKQDKHTGYDLVIQRNLRVFLDTLDGLDYSGFLRGCPRFPGYVTEMDLMWALQMKDVAVGFADRKDQEALVISVPTDPYDPISFVTFKSKIVQEIEKEIKRSDPRNMDAEVAEKSIADLNSSITAVIQDIVPQKVDQILPKEVERQESIVKEEYEKALNALYDKDEQKDKKIEELESRIREIQEIQEFMKQSPAPSPLPASAPTQEEVPKPDKLPLVMQVNRFWTVKTKDIDDSIWVQETRGKEGGGELNLTVSAGAGNLYWIVNSTPEGQSILYERLKKIMTEFMETGSVHSDLMYAMPREGETRIFTPRVTNGQIYTKDGWEPQKGVFSREFSSLLIVSLGESRFTMDFKLRLSELAVFKGLIRELVNRVLLSGDEVINGQLYA